jgi:hypothetical protein
MYAKFTQTEMTMGKLSGHIKLKFVPKIAKYSAIEAWIWAFAF